MTHVGSPDPRADGLMKATGQARYTGDLALPGLVDAVLVHSTIAHGRVSRIDAAAASRAPGVLAVYTPGALPGVTFPEWDHSRPHGQSYMPLQDDRVLYAGQPLALIVADTADRAQWAGTLIEIDYEASPHVVFDREAASSAIVLPPRISPNRTSTGDPAGGFAAGPVRQDATFTTSDRHHNPMEPYVTIASWSVDGTLTLFDTTQYVEGCRDLMAVLLGMDKAKINVVSHFLGGGFGGKAWTWPHTVLAALAARKLGRPVRLQLTREQMYAMTGHQATTVQTVALASSRSGRFTAIRHDVVAATSMSDDYMETAALGTRSLWRAGGIETSHRALRTHRNAPTVMRSPFEGVGNWALEAAVDELAYTLKMNPVALRLANEPEHDPATGRSFSTRGIRRCLAEGAERFGWADRPMEPRSMRDGSMLIGQGVACAIYTHNRVSAKARATMRADGTVLIEAAMHDIGTGTYTIMRQIAADELGVGVGAVVVSLGDTRLPASAPAFGSCTASNAGSAVMLAARALRERLAAVAVRRGGGWAGLDPAALVARDDGLAAGASGKVVSYREIVGRQTGGRVTADGDYHPLPEAKGDKAVFSFAAMFAEVAVDPDFGLVRLRRYVGAYDAGRIVNPRTARSQAIGGIIWGVGQALTEQSETDPRSGRIMGRNLSSYLVPTNADIPELDVIFAGEHDADGSLLGSKGIGEVTAVSVPAAIANAVFHATGRRVRELPIRPEHLL